MQKVIFYLAYHVASDDFVGKVRKHSAALIIIINIVFKYKIWILSVHSGS
jgi:hypothetical protein